MQGIGIHCGRSGWLVIDIDHPETMTTWRTNPPNLQSEWLAKMLDKYPTAYQMTRANWQSLEGEDAVLGRFRRHVVYAMPDGEPLGNGTGALGNEWGDIRGENGYIAAYPTPHPKGGEYRWDTDGSGLTVMPLPEEIEKRLRQRAFGKNGKGNVTNGTGDEPILEGKPGRNSTLAGMAGHMRSAGLNHDAIRVALLTVNATRCEPPLDEQEVESIAASISSYPPGEALSAVGAWWAQQHETDTAGSGDSVDGDGSDDATEKFKEELEHLNQVEALKKAERVSRQARRELDSEERAAVQSISIVSSEDILAMPDLRWLVTNDDDRGILACEGIFELSAQRQQFKTAIILDLLLSITNKLDHWLGWKLDTSTDDELPHVVLAIGEGGAGMRRRIEAWLAAHPGSSLSRFHLVPFNGFCLTSPSDITTILSTIKEKVGSSSVAVTVFDAFPDIFTGDENGAGDVGRAVSGMRRIARELGDGLCGVTQHSGYDTSRGRGSSRLPDAMDTVMHVEDRVIKVAKVKEDDADVIGLVPMTAVPVKSSFVVRRSDGSLGDAAARNKRRSSPNEVGKQKILQVLQFNGETHVSALKDSGCGGKPAIMSRLDELVAEGKVDSREVGKTTLFKIKGT